MVDQASNHHTTTTYLWLHIKEKEQK